MPDFRTVEGGPPLSHLISCRLASQGDADAVAALHADSWRRHYRGAYLDSFLDGDVVADRRDVWSKRLSASTQAHITIVAARPAEIIGFAHLVFDHDPTWGSYLENLHVAAYAKRQGIGTLLLSAVAGALHRSRPSGSLYLWVLDQNKSAQAFYCARGGVRVGTELRGPFPGGGRAMGHRVAWSEPSQLISVHPGGLGER